MNIKWTKPDKTLIHRAHPHTDIALVTTLDHTVMKSGRQPLLVLWSMSLPRVTGTAGLNHDSVCKIPIYHQTWAPGSAACPCNIWSCCPGRMPKELGKSHLFHSRRGRLLLCWRPALHPSSPGLHFLTFCLCLCVSSLSGSCRSGRAVLGFTVTLLSCEYSLSTLYQHGACLIIREQNDPVTRH